MALFHGIFLDNNSLVILKLELDNETSIFKKQYIICNINVDAFKKKLFNIYDNWHGIFIVTNRGNSTRTFLYLLSS